MNNLRKSIVCIFIGALIASCGTAAPVSIVALTETIPPPITAISPTSKPLPIAADTPTPTPTLPVSAAPDGLRLRMAYIIDGNLYFQDGENSPAQLTDSEEKNSLPTFSDDGEKIIFYRGFVPHELYSINTDGTDEKVLVTGNLLGSLSLDYDKFTEIISLAYVPDTHLVLFNTRQLSQEAFDQKDFNRKDSKENFDLLSVNTDTGELRILLEKGTGGDFFISPNGNMVAILVNGHIDVINMDGQMVHRSLVDYHVTHPYTLRPKVFWNANSTEFTVTLPKREIFDLSGPETLLVGQYSVDGSKDVVMAFDPPVLDGDYDVSPDGNWILYNYFYYPAKTDESITSGLYLGNLYDKSTQLYAHGTNLPIWHPDSKHFVFNGPFLGDVDGPSSSMGYGLFLGWFDSTRYLLYQPEMKNLLLVEIGGDFVSIPHQIPSSSFGGGDETFSFFSVSSE